MFANVLPSSYKRLFSSQYRTVHLLMLACFLGGFVFSRMFNHPDKQFTSHLFTNVTRERTTQLRATPEITHTDGTSYITSLRNDTGKRQQPFLFGLGPEADQAMQTRLFHEGNVRMLTSWYNGPNDLLWITDWSDDLVPHAYANNYTFHLVTFTDLPEGPLETPYGPACGRAYPLSLGFLDDIRKVAQTFRGKGNLYVTLFTEFQTYPCSDNEWVGSENYYKTLKDQYKKAVQIFHTEAPNAKVGISWGGWQSRWDDKAKGGGRSLIPYFEDSIKISDITAFQAMQSDTNAQDIRDMTKILGKYGKPVMLSHFRPDNGSQETFEKDVHVLFTDEVMKELQQNGLMGISFMNSLNSEANEDVFQFVKGATERYGK
jgi:hypothetical protein